LVIPVGDPAGIGPEVVLKALADLEVAQDCEITLVGSRRLLRQVYSHLKHQDLAIANSDHSFWDVDLGWQVSPGVGSAASGAASFAYLDLAVAQTLAGKFDAVVTAPIAKSAWKSAGYCYAGQTELLAERAQVKQVGMLFVADSPYTSWTLRTLLATTHIPLREVADTLTPTLLSAKLDLLVDCLSRDFGLKTPRIAIAGLNPHSGEQGQLGSEEQDWLIPWLQQEQSRRPQIRLEGPVPPDTLWVRPAQAWFGTPTRKDPLPRHDAYLALYHDQGLIPVKLLAFDQAVNTTIGLPFVRTSPDHGTAFDIAGQGIANPTSMKAAMRLAATLVRQRLALSSAKHSQV